MLRPQALRSFFQTAPIVLMGTSPPTQLPELLPQGRLAKVKHVILDFPLEEEMYLTLGFAQKSFQRWRRYMWTT